MHVSTEIGCERKSGFMVIHLHTACIHHTKIPCFYDLNTKVWKIVSTTGGIKEKKNTSITTFLVYLKFQVSSANQKAP